MIFYESNINCTKSTPVGMEINLEVVHSIIRLQVKNHENTRNTSGILSILFKIVSRKISKSPLSTDSLKIMVSQKNNHYGQNILPILIIFLL